MDKAISKAAVLIEALPYIRSFQGKIVVIKLGGAFMESVELVRSVLEDITFIHSVGIYPVVVHGGGPRITERMQAEGVIPKWVGGRRVTDERVLEIVEDVLIDNVNRQIVQGLKAMGVPAVPVHKNGINSVVARKRQFTDEQGYEIDLGFVGEVTDVDTNLLWVALKGGAIPVIAPVCSDGHGQGYNVNADDVACQVAAHLKAAKIVMMTDTHGIRTNVDDPDSILSSATEAEIMAMIDDGTIAGGMLPKVKSCLHCIDHGVAKAHILDGRIKHALLLEIYTDHGIGTQILKK